MSDPVEMLVDIVYLIRYHLCMKNIVWSIEKNYQLIRERNISFEEILAGKILDIIHNPGAQYRHQKIMIILYNKYVYCVPFVEDPEKKFLKTIIPSRKYTHTYLGGADNEKE
jgi:hypothetical protein